MSKEKCQNADTHKGPYFTITMVAFQSGPGSRKNGKQRRMYRHVMGRLCRECLRRSRIRVKGQRILPKKRVRQSAGLPALKVAA